MKNCAISSLCRNTVKHIKKIALLTHCMPATTECFTYFATRNLVASNKNTPHHEHFI